MSTLKHCEYGLLSLDCMDGQLCCSENDEVVGLTTNGDLYGDPVQTSFHS